MNYKSVAFLSMGLLSTAATLEAAERPNVLVFLVDDLRPQLGCYGYDLVKSPNIDALAEDGIKFNKAYVQEAISAPSRMSILTGKRPENIGIYSLFTKLRSQHPDMLTMPQFFKESGYKTISVGKVFHHANDDAQSWTTLEGRKGDNWALAESARSSDGKIAGMAYECADVAEDAYYDGNVTKDAIAALRANKDESFMMVVGFSKPHLPFCAPKEYWDMYDPAEFDIPLKEAPEGNNAYSLAPWGELRGYRDMPKEGVLDDDTSRTLIHGYNACVSFTDAQVGKVMAELEALDLRDNTIVILLGDHGWKIGEYGAWCKHSNSEIDTNIPFIISRETGYKKRKTGVESDALVEAVDLFPTIADYCGLSPEGLDGQSLMPLTDKPNMKWDEAAYSLYPRGKGVMGFTCTDGEFRYLEWWSNKEDKVLYSELYTCKQDYSKRVRNLANDAEYAKVVARMKSLLSLNFPEDKRSSYPQLDK